MAVGGTNSFASGFGWNVKGAAVGASDDSTRRAPDDNSVDPFPVALVQNDLDSTDPIGAGESNGAKSEPDLGELDPSSAHSGRPSPSVNLSELIPSRSSFSSIKYDSFLNVDMAESENDQAIGDGPLLVEGGDSGVWQPSTGSSTDPVDSSPSSSGSSEAWP